MDRRPTGVGGVGQRPWAGARDARSMTAPSCSASCWLAVVELNRRHGLRLDTEVTYAVKLTGTAAGVRRSLALAGFAGQEPSGTGGGAGTRDGVPEAGRVLPGPVAGGGQGPPN